jgi:transposase
LSTPVFVGIDVGAYHLDVHIHSEDAYITRTLKVPNTAVGHRQIARALRGLDVASVVCEATGKLERAIVRYLGQQGYAVAVLNPLQLIGFRKACGVAAKTDALDAELLARFAQTMRPAARPLPDEVVLDLRELVVRRQQVVASRTAESNRALRTESPLAKRQIAASLRLLDKQTAELDAAILAAIKANPSLASRYDLLLSIKGLGPVAAMTLLAEMPELGLVSDNAIAALAGLAPINNDSGTLRRRAKCTGGRKSVRCALYMAAMAAKRFNPPIALFYQRLVAKGKPKLIALTASMRKLLIIANHIISSGMPWLAPLPFSS